MANSFSINAVIKAIDQFTGPVRGMIRTTERFGNSAKKLGKKMTAGITLPLLLMGGIALSSFGNFEDGMASVSTLVDETIESISEMSKEVRNLAKVMPVKLSDLTSALYDVRSAGVSASGAMDVLEGSARLGVAGLGSTKEAVDLVTSSINSFGLSAEEQVKIYDVIFKTVKSGKTTISQLAQGFGGVAATVANANIKLDEYLASVAALTTTGLPAAQAHTQLKAVIAGVTRETALSKAMFERLGAKTFKDLIKQSGGLVPALKKIDGVLKGNDGAIIKLFGSTEAYSAVIALTTRQNAAYVETLDDMRNGENQVDKAFRKKANTFNSSMKIMRNQINDVGLTVGAILAPAILAVAAHLSTFVAWFDALSPAVQEWSVWIGVAVAASGPLIAALGMIAIAVTAITWPVLAVVAAIAIIAGLAYLVIKNWSTVGPYFKQIFGGISDFLTGWSDIIVGLFTLDFSRMGAGILKVFKGIFNTIAGLFSGLFSGTGGLIKLIFGKDDPKDEPPGPGGGDGPSDQPAAPPGSGGGDGPSVPVPTPSVRSMAATQSTAQGSAGQLNSQVTVSFENAPKGMRVDSISSDQPGVEIDTDVGYSMVTP